MVEAPEKETHVLGAIEKMSGGTSEGEHDEQCLIGGQLVVPFSPYKPRAQHILLVVQKHYAIFKICDIGNIAWPV